MRVHEIIPLLRGLKWIEISDVTGRRARLGFRTVGEKLVVAIDTGEDTINVYVASGVNVDELRRFLEATAEYARVAPIARELPRLLYDWLVSKASEVEAYVLDRGEVLGSIILWAVDDRGREYIVARLPAPVMDAHYLVAIHEPGADIIRVYTKSLENALVDVIRESRVADLNAPGARWLRLSQPLASIAPDVAKTLHEIAREAMIENMYRLLYVSEVTGDEEYECRICGRIEKIPGFAEYDDKLRLLAYHIREAHPEAWKELKKAATRLAEYLATSTLIERRWVERLVEEIVEKAKSRATAYA